MVTFFFVFSETWKDQMTLEIAKLKDSPESKQSINNKGRVGMSVGEKVELDSVK